MVIPLEIHPIWNPELPDGERAKQVGDFARENQMDCRRQFLQTQRASWFIGVVIPWLMSLKPDEWPDNEFADSIGITREQLWRYKNGKGAPSDEVVYQWLRFWNKSYGDMPPISKQSLYAAFGVEAAVQISCWKQSTTRKIPLRRQRTIRPSNMPVADVILTYLLVGDAQFRGRWLQIAYMNHADVTAALMTPDLPNLLQDLVDTALRIATDASSEMTELSPVLDDLAHIDIKARGPGGMLARLLRLWNRHQFDWFCTHDCTCDLHGDLLLQQPTSPICQSYSGVCP